MSYRLLSVVLASFLLLGCATHQHKDALVRLDPIEGFNRSMFEINYNLLDYYLVRPTAVIWRDYVPKPVRNGLSNFFNNWQEPTTMVNYVVEGNLYKAMVHFNCFFLNTMLGMGGLIDVASMANQKLAKEVPRRFGSTLGHYGIGYGTYLQLPGYGSFTPREDIGDLVDYIYPMLSYLTWWMSVSKWVLESLEYRAQLLSSDSLLNNSQDPYSIMYTTYFQRHDFMASGGALIPQNNQNIRLLQDDLNTIDAQ